MKNLIVKCLFVGFCSVLLISCEGEGQSWERQMTNTMFPYGNQRTAGSGVAYVLAKMMPKKDLNLTSVTRQIRPEVLDSYSGNTTKDMIDQYQETLRK